MKALIRGEEVLTENMNVKLIDWDTGQPLTNTDWAGGPYTLVQNYNPPAAKNEMENPTTDSNTKRNAEIAEIKARLAALEKEV